jgi:hypothetical protein
MTSSRPDPGRIPASTGVPPDAPNAKHDGDRDLADGPPATDDVVEVEHTDDG